MELLAATVPAIKAMPLSLHAQHLCGRWCLIQNRSVSRARTTVIFCKVFQKPKIHYSVFIFAACPVTMVCAFLLSMHDFFLFEMLLCSLSI